MKFRKLLSAAGAVALAIGALSLGLFAAPAEAKRIERSFNLQGVERHYIAHLPDNPSARSSWPVIFAFHPGAATGKWMERATSLHEKPAAKNYVVVYPDGYKRLWNVGYCCGDPQKLGLDDIGFVSAIMDDLGKMLPVEPKIYATGFSNGSLFTYYLLCNRSEMVAAAAPYAAVLDWNRVRCSPKATVPIMHMHGTADPRAPYLGGRTDNTGVGLHQPVASDIDFWAGKDGCSTATRQINLVPGAPACTARYQCSGGAQVIQCLIPDLGHIWPGDRENFVTRRMGLGEARNDVDGSAAVLNFFEMYRK